MFTKRMLRTVMTPVTAAIKQPTQYEMTGRYYPTKYPIRHDAAAHEFEVSLHDMVKR